MLFENFIINKRKLSFNIYIVVLCATFCNICSSTEQDIWNATIQEVTIKFVQQLKSNVNTNIRPCDDFHGYICDKKNNSNQFTVRPTEEDIFRKFLQNDDEDQLLDAELKLKHFYESCQNTRGIEYLKNTNLYTTIGGWPAIEQNAPNLQITKPWLNVLASFHEIGIDAFFKHRIEIKSNKRNVQLEANTVFRNSPATNALLAKELLHSFGINSTQAHVIALDYAGLQGYHRETVGRTITTTISRPLTMTYNDFKSKFTNIDWDVYFRRVLGKPLKSTDGIRIDDEEKLKRVFDLLSKTPTNRLLNYLWIDYLQDKNTASCLDLIREYFQPVYRYIVQRSSIDKRRIVKLFSEIGSVYQSLLPETIWIDEISNQKSKLYLAKMIHMTLNGDSKLDEDYASLTMTKTNFYSNLEKCQKYSQNSRSRRQSLVSMSSTPAASLTDLYEFFMGPMYDAALPQPMYYGSIGEAFSEKMIDGGYSSTPGSWRSSDSDEKYAQLERCLREQNANFEFSNAVGNRLVRRILAERQTFEALLNWVSGNGNVVNRIRTALSAAERGMNLEKMYFYMSVYTHCDEDKEFVNTYLKNSRDFAETFGCSTGSLLKPLKVCSVL